MKLLKRGAEAELYLIDWFGYKAIKKIRIAKSCRVKVLDEYLRSYRTLNEAKLLINVKKVGVPVPTVFDVNINEYSITMEFIDGILLRDLLFKLNIMKIKELFTIIGTTVGKMHSNGFFHGDLTTSNIIVVDDSIFLIDFGLGGFSREIEVLGVDIHLMLRALESTHHEISTQCFEYFKDGYARHFYRYKEVFNKVGEIRKRGRYVIERRIKGLQNSIHF